MVFKLLMLKIAMFGVRAENLPVVQRPSARKYEVAELTGFNLGPPHVVSTLRGGKLPWTKNRVYDLLSKVTLTNRAGEVFRYNLNELEVLYQKCTPEPRTRYEPLQYMVRSLGAREGVPIA